MKLVTRRRRVLAILLGIALLVTLVFQILHDGKALEMKRMTNFKTNTK